jgi:hypothetical protein
MDDTDDRRTGSDGDGSDADPNAIEGTYLVTHADDGGTVLRDVDSGQVHTVAGTPAPGPKPKPEPEPEPEGKPEPGARAEVEAGEVLDATLAPEPPAGVLRRVVAVDRRRRIPVERSPEPPTRQARELVAGGDPGEAAVRERAGEGELHVLRVPEDLADDAASDVLEDDSTLARAARMPAITRVEVRAAEDVVSVRYLP